MKENQMEVMTHSKGYEKGADLLSFSSCELRPENDHCQTNLDTLARGLAIVDDYWNNGVAMNSEPVDNHPKNGTEDGFVPFVQNQEVPGWHSSDSEKATGSLTSTTNDNDEIRSSPVPMPSENLDEFNPRSEQNFKEYETPSSSISGLLEPDVYTYTDKNVVECETPELDVPSNVHVVKDICVDTGTAPQERISIESNKDDHGALITPQQAKEDMAFESINGDLDAGVFVLDDSEGSAVEDVKKNSSDNFASWEKFESMELDESKIFPEENAGENSSTLFGARIVPKMDEQSIDSSDGVADIVSEEASSISSTRVSGEFMMQDTLLNSLKQEGDREAQESDEVPSLDTILESLAVMFNSKESKKEDQMSKLSYNSKVEDGTITFDFKASKPSSEEDTNAAPLTNGNSKEQSSATSNVEINEAVAKKDVDSGIITTTTNTTTTTEERLLPPPQVQSVNGESSFSMMEPVSGLITYSGQIAYAGSTSLRSDSSTTSTRSFAFPVLQSEWNSSPVRMQKAVPRRRRNNWHSFFCCRF